MAGDLPPYLSVSQITCYLQCPRKYKFRYIERREPERRAVELAFGSAVHASVAWWATERVAGREPTVDAIPDLAPGRDLIVLPLLIGAGRHATHDLARRLGSPRAGVKVVVDRPLGLDPSIEEIVVDLARTERI